MNGGEKMENKLSVALCIVMFAVGMIFWLAVDASTGTNYHISTPITSLEPGRVYEVKAMYRDLASCYLLLKPDGETSIKYYNLASTSVPMEVAVGNRIARLSSGITIVP